MQICQVSGNFLRQEKIFRSNHGFLHIVEVVESLEHVLTVLLVDSGLCIGQCLAQGGIFGLTHQQASILVEVSHRCFQNGLYHLGLEATIVEFEVIPNDPTVTKLIGVALHTNAEGITFVGYQTVCRLLVHTIRESNSSTCHTIGEIVSGTFF